MVRIAFDMYNLWSDVFRSVANRVDQNAAADRTIRAGRTGLLGPRDLKLLQLGVSWLKIKSENCGCCTTNCCDFQKITA